MKKILLVFGTRPEAIKMCPLVLELKKRPNIKTVVCTTGQHKEMLQQVLDIFDVIPDYSLDIMRPEQTLTMINTHILLGIETVLKDTQPDIVLVHGDTTTSMAAALAAFYQKIPVGHVEAGLRSNNKYSPYPEEINRVFITKLADFNFCPTEQNRRTLLEEGVADETIFVTGNTVIDAIKTTVKPGYTFKCKKIAKIDFSKKVILLTFHRRENLGTPLQNLCDAVLQICAKNPDIQLVYPVHPNPLVYNVVHKNLGGHPQIHLTKPLDVEDLHNLMKQCYLVLTDSGGLQEEAPHLGKPVLVLRTETERPEAVCAGTVKVIGTNKDAIVHETSTLLHSQSTYTTMSHAVNPYGDGNASILIANALEKILANK